MIKNVIIAALTGVLLARILPAGLLTDAAALGISFMAYAVLLLAEAVWERHRRRVTVRLRWCGIGIMDLLNRRRRRKRIKKYAEALGMLQLEICVRGERRHEEDHLYLRQMREKD